MRRAPRFPHDTLPPMTSASDQCSQEDAVESGTEPKRRIEAVVFDVGETLVDETRSWSEAAQAVGMPTFTVFGALGSLIQRGEDHRGLWDLLGVERPRASSPIEVADFYPDALPALHAIGAAGYRIGIAGNQPAGVVERLDSLALPVDFVASSAAWEWRSRRQTFSHA
jgi:FMN phosphatase YigB (HAD superfamily)